MLLAVRLPLTLLTILVLAAPARAQDTGWVIDRMDVRMEIAASGTVTTREAIDVDFRNLARRGIFRDIDDRFDFDATHTRRFDIGLISVTDADGESRRVREEREGSAVRFRIGDPDRTISGRQGYRLNYTIGGALNGFDTHDELYWNVTGARWPVPIESASVVVRAPQGAIERVECFQGRRGSTNPCDARYTPDEATFSATRPLEPGEELTIVVGLKKGAVAEPEPRLVTKPRDVMNWFETTPDIVVMTAAGMGAVVIGLIWLWWAVGRDRRFVSLYRGASPDSPGGQERVPLFGGRPMGVEFEPPDGIRPGQMGLLVDERADTLDVTATIVDLAVRGYLSITELPKDWWFSRRDYMLDRLKPADDALLPYERIIFDGLFGFRDAVELSDLKNKFYKTLDRAKDALYQDAVARGWFPTNPKSVRKVARVLGLLAIPAGLALVIYLGTQWGAGLLGLPIAAGGVLMMLFARAMPRRTAAGRDLLRRTLGFAKYIRTGEVRQQAFAERAGIFTAYLPYAIAFRCVDRWAKAFKDLDMQAATAGWYAGTSRFDAGGFSSNLNSFSSSIASTMASTPGGSGGSGFSGGGSSGGGGGGGGGGSW
jgi:uncharacterized protein (TIGR04222 family)